MCIVPSALGTENQNASDNNAKIGLKENKNVLEVNAASKKKKTSTKVKSKKTTKKVTTKKVKAASTTKKTYTSYSTSGSWSDDSTLDSIVRAGSRYGYSHSYHTGAQLVAHGAGDCWAMSDYLNGQFQAAGYQSRIIQYATSYSSRHRSVQVMRNGAWQTVPYRSYGYNYLFV